ncbi:hypothetical protein VTO73DRAFT_2804 [Trametes versicolor]
MFEDTKARRGSDEDTRWNFRQLLLCAQQSSVRIVLLDRRGYPGALPHVPEELSRRARVVSLPPMVEAAQETTTVMVDHGRDGYDCLVDFILRERIPAARGSTSGVILVGWSLGGLREQGPNALEAHTPVMDTSSSISDLADSMNGPPMEDQRLLIEACLTHGT